jgi:hypothetical protein
MVDALSGATRLDDVKIQLSLGKKRFQREREITYKYTKETFKK